MKQKLFPDDFLWGASTASHQVEGGNTNQWTEWEEANANRLAHTAKQRLGLLPNWEDFKAEATDPENYISGAGIDHYNRYKEDFDLLKGLNCNAFRFGIEWSRIEPKQGQWDQAEIDHYKAYIAELNSRGIKPVLNMWHWTMPTWFTDKGGFATNANLEDWERFSHKVAKEFCGNVQMVITINEPNVYASFGYLAAEWPPAERNPLKFMKVYYNLTRAHKIAYRAIKARHPHVQIGIAHQIANMQAKRPHNLLDQTSTKVMRYAWNWWFYNRIRNQMDYVGFNYYFTDYYKGFKHANPSVPKSDLGWYMEPEGIYPLMLRLWAHYKKPIYITENGLADSADKDRRWWIEESIVAMERAISEGVDVRGYFHWSLLDNFEWAYGWWPQFGLIHVDREHGMKRTVRPSAEWYASKIKELS